eukprot:g14319.t1
MRVFLLFAFVWLSLRLAESIDENLYDVIGVDTNCDKRTIKRAYRKLAIKYHPDKVEGDKVYAKEVFQKIANAYEILSNDAKRAEYDRFMKEKESINSLRQNDVFAGMREYYSFEDPFKVFADLLNEHKFNPMENFEEFDDEIDEPVYYDPEGINRRNIHDLTDAELFTDDFKVKDFVKKAYGIDENEDDQYYQSVFYEADFEGGVYDSYTGQYRSFSQKARYDPNDWEQQKKKNSDRDAQTPSAEVDSKPSDQLELVINELLNGHEEDLEALKMLKENFGDFYQDNIFGKMDEL